MSWKTESDHYERWKCRENSIKRIEKCIENLISSNEVLKEKAISCFKEMPIRYKWELKYYDFIENILNTLSQFGLNAYPPVSDSIVWYVIINDLFRKTAKTAYEVSDDEKAFNKLLDDFEKNRFEPLFQIAQKITFHKETMDVLGNNLQEHEVVFDSYLVAYDEKLKEIYKDYFNCDLFLLSVSNKNKKERIENQNEAKKAIKENKEIR